MAWWRRRPESVQIPEWVGDPAFQAEADAWLDAQAERLSPEDYRRVFQAWLSRACPDQPWEWGRGTPA